MELNNNKTEGRSCLPYSTLLVWCSGTLGVTAAWILHGVNYNLGQENLCKARQTRKISISLDVVCFKHALKHANWSWKLPIYLHSVVTKSKIQEYIWSEIEILVQLLAYMRPDSERRRI